MPLPRLPASCCRLVELVPSSQTTALLASRSETTALAVLVHRLDDPVDARIAADRLVLRVDEDDFVVLVGGILVDPVGVEHTQIGAAAADTLLSGGLEGALVLELVHTLIGGLAYTNCMSMSLFYRIGHVRTVGSTFRHWPFATTLPHTNTVDDIALLGLISETASLVWTRWAGSAMDDIELAELI